MSNKVKKMASNLENINNCFFPNSMYTVFPGSVLICYSIFEKPTEEEKLKIKKMWLRVQKHPNKFYKTPEQFYDPKYTLNVFGLTNKDNWQVAVFIGQTNTLLAPYGMTNKGDIFAYPLREDSITGPTLAHPVSVHPLKWENSENDNDSNSNIQKH